jgi:hypothetical protein
MTNQNYISEIFVYFSKFVPEEVLRDLFKQPSVSQHDEYQAMVDKIFDRDGEDVIPGIGTFIVSANKKYVFDRVKNSKGLVLFVEYGMFKLDPTGTGGVTEKIGVTVAKDYNIANNDNLNEALIMNECNNVLNSILVKMNEDQNLLTSCGMGSLIEFPADVYPIDPSEFQDRLGWTALFDNEKTGLMLL